MKTENGYEESGPGPALGQWVPPGYPLSVELSTPPVPRRTRLRRLIRTPLRVLAFASLAAVFGFLGGWLGPSVFPEDTSTPVTADEKRVEAILPKDGVTLDVSWGDLPQQLTQAGVIDLEKFKAAAQRAGAPLSPNQLKILTEGSDDSVTFDGESAYFALDVLWALGLANNNTVLTQGPIAQRGWDQAGGLASTGGWTIGAEPGPGYLATMDLISMTPEQQAVVDEVAYNSYRPCCGNMTAFPDCNHGMAALGLTELMASQGASADEIFQALKDVSPFWFPKQYYQLAMYFESQNQEWDEVDPRLVMSRDYSSAGGAQQVSAWLQQQGGLGTGGGVSGGNASGCAP